MKIRILFLGVLFLSLSFLVGCKKKAELPQGMEYAPICPEGFAWIESSKSCELIFVD